jgi:ABC-2 type transport system permease protein
MTGVPTIDAAESRDMDEGPQTSPSRWSRGGACWALYLLTLRQHLHGKRWIAATLLFMAPVAIAVLIRISRSGPPSVFREFVLCWILVPQAILPLIALLYGSGIIQDEEEDQTITYLIVRPISKPLLYWTKMAATWTTIVVLVFALTTLTYAAIYLMPDMNWALVSQRLIKAVAILALAAITYCSIFGLLSLITRHVLIVGAIYIVIVEGLLASLPFSLRTTTVIYYTRLMAYRSLPFEVVWPRGRHEDVAATAWFLDTKADPTLAQYPSLRACIMVLLTGIVLFTLIAGLLCSRREFHAKTPEKQ